MPAPITLTQKLDQLIRMRQTAQVWEDAYKIAREMVANVNLEVKDSQLAATTTHIAMSAQPWMVQQHAFNPKDYVDPVHGRLRPPMEPLELKAYFDTLINGDVPKEKGNVRYFNTVLGGLFDSDERHTFCAFMFGNPSSKETTFAQRWVTIRWSGSTAETGWEINPVAIVEAKAIIEYARLHKDEIR